MRQFPVETLKIDRSFVEALGEDPQALSIVRSVVALAEALDLSVTAEGVETAAQRAQLRKLGCDRRQGYLFAKPLAPGELANILSGNPPGFGETDLAAA